jgi:hypothetical protein
VSVWYLDLDDEITDAVARLRAAKDDKVVLVIPPGSRIGTGRINFRLLAREAETRGLTVALVSSDPQVRALGASAGLTAHARVTDAERALGLEVDEESTGTRASAVPPAARVATAVSTTADPAADEAAAVGKVRRGGLLHRRREGYAVTPRTATAAAGEETGAVTVIPYGPGDGARIVRRGPSTRRRVATWGTRGAIIGALAAGALYVAYLTVPTATVTLTPGTSTYGPEQTSIVASPNTPVVDVVTGAIPAEWYKIPLIKSGTFDATGRDEVTTFAKGKVSFVSKNTILEMTIPEGTRVATADGREYKTLQSLLLDKWDGEGPKPRGEVPVQAIRRGKDGNTGAETISVVKGGLSRLAINVNNPEPITGGDRFFRQVVTTKDCNAARAALVTELEADLAVAAAEPGTPGLTRYPESATLAEVALTPTCEELVDSSPEAGTFELKAQTTGTVLEVDESALEEVAAQHVQLEIDPSTQIEPGSVTAARAGEPVVEADRVTFPMAVTALVTLPWDAAAIKQEIAGKPVSAAKELLSKYGTATLTMWPDFVPNVPTDAGRISLIIPTTEE